ncbi:MAG: efflux RND transporter periplasmic adaptor subunit [Candidatus Magasanikbacteria bacterium]|nr:efflux RND transporter periplasmic adaptor subunit [Candidatus Magasanikbacteria bacterium]
MSFFKTKKFYVGLVVVLALGGYGIYRHRVSSQTPAFETAKVEQGTLTQSVDATGQIQSANDVSLKFEIPGILSTLNVKEGDQVKAGQVLASLRVSELNASVAQAVANLNKQLAGATPEYIAQLQASLDKAKNDLSQAQGVGNDAEGSKLVQNSYDDLVVTLQSMQVVLASSLTSADNILGMDNTLANNNFRNYLSVLNTDYLNKAKNNYLDAKDAKTTFDISVNSLSKISSHGEIDISSAKADAAMVKMKNLLYYVSLVLDNTPPVGTLTQAGLDTMKSGIQSARTDLNLKYSALNTNTHAIVTARNNYSSYQSLVDKAQAALKDAQNPPREVDVASYRASVAQAVAARNKAIIVAPISGIVTKVNHKVGESVSGAEEMIKLLSPHYEIQVDVSETDIAKIKLEQPVTMTLDAFGEDVKFTGKVFNIDPGSTNVQDVVYYKVKISLDDSDKPVKPGMTANVSILTDKRVNTLFIPSRAIITSDALKQVKILQNNLAVTTTIKTGMKGDNGKVEVTEGLYANQEIILGAKQ